MKNITKLILSRSNIILLVIIGAVAISLSALSYQYSTYNARQIAANADEDVRKDTERQATDIRGILENKINTVVSNLHIIANTPSVERGEELESRVLFDTAENTIGAPLDFVAWLNSDGRLVWSSNVNASTWAQYGGVDLSMRPYFIEARDTREPYFSSIIESVDDIPRVFMSVPVIDNEQNFRGIVYAGYRLDTAAQLVRDEVIEEDSESRILLMSKDGVLLYSRSPEFVGRNLLDEAVLAEIIPSRIPGEEREKVNVVLRDALAGKSGSIDITINDVRNTVAFEPVILNGKHFLTLFILTPHIFAKGTAFLIEQQNNVNTIIIAAIGAMAFAMSFLVLGWNKRLQAAVDARTEELQEANKRLIEANEQLKVASKMQKEFINIAAHELRTPTQAILGYIELLELQKEETEDGKKMMTTTDLRGISRNAKRLQRLTEDILDVTRIESNSLHLNLEKFDLSEVIQTAIYDAQSRLANGKIKFIYNNNEPKEKRVVITVNADKERIMQVLSNLLDNSIKFTKEGTISISAQRAGDRQVAMVSIKDTGTGIHPDIMPKLFTKFTTKSEKGTGLGLFLTKSIVEAHGGEIWAENNSDVKGATFTFTIPLEQQKTKDDDNNSDNRC